MKTFSASLALCAGNSPVAGEFPSQRPVTRSFYVFFDLCLKKRLSKQSWGWWFETPSRSLWCHCNGHNNTHYIIFDSSIGRPFRSPLWRWRKMAALPLPAAILDDLIPSFRVREWGHPRWRPEAEGPPSCATATMGIEKAAPSPGWRHFRRRHLESKMAAPQVTSGGPRNSREILRKVWSYQKNVP